MQIDYQIMSLGLPEFLLGSTLYIDTQNFTKVFHTVFDAYLDKRFPTKENYFVKGMKYSKYIQVHFVY